MHAGFQRLERVESITHLLVDETTIYWMDASGTLRAQPLPRAGVASAVIPTELRAASEEPLTPIGKLVQNDTTVFWAEASVEMSDGPLEPAPAPPPGRIFAAGKNGEGTELLFESAEFTYGVLAVERDRLLLRVNYGPEELFALSLESHELEPWLPELPPSNLQISGQFVYWSTPSEGSSDETGYFNDLFRADLNGMASEFVAKIEGNASVFGDLVLWQQERTHTEPLVLDQNFVAFSQSDGCQWRLPNVGETISYSYLADESHVYWHSYNGLGSVSPSDPALPEMRLIRVNLNDGKLEQVIVPGFTPDLGSQIVAQTSDRLFVWGNAGLVAIDKHTDADAPLAEGACVWGVDNLLAEVGEESSARQFCGHMNAAEFDQLSSALDCVESADPALGAQFTINRCVDCQNPTTYLETPTGNRYAVLLEADVFGDQVREAKVQRCDAFEFVDDDVVCTGAETLYSCSEPLR